MRRVTRPGGVVAACVWDYPGEMTLLRTFRDAAAALEPELLIPAHGLPIAGARRIRTVLEDVAFALESLVEQTLALNPPPDIAAFLKEMANRHRHNMEWARAEAIKAFDE